MYGILKERRSHEKPNPNGYNKAKEDVTNVDSRNQSDIK